MTDLTGMDLPTLRDLAAEVWTEILARETLVHAAEEATEVEEASAEKMKELAARFHAARDRDDQGDQPPPWVKPTGAHDAYWPDYSVSHLGVVWESLVDGNTTEPGDFKITPQTWQVVT